ncbi:MAG: hypothetical protein P4N59_03170 [Negativicutes bacterium]|nr:hypothetical protein [Negativicutes bacterium]
MRKTRDRRYVTLDIEHMRRLHQEAIEQLELLRTALESAEQASGTMRDGLNDIALDHWNAYMDVMHMIAMHDETMANVMTKHDMQTRDNDNEEQTDKQLFGNNQLTLLLLRALTRRHRRFWDIYGGRGNPMSDYLKESMTVEREHMAELMEMIQDTL